MSQFCFPSCEIRTCLRSLRRSWRAVTLLRGRQLTKQTARVCLKPAALSGAAQRPGGSAPGEARRAGRWAQLRCAAHKAGQGARQLQQVSGDVNFSVWGAGSACPGSARLPAASRLPAVCPVSDMLRVSMRTVWRDSRPLRLKPRTHLGNAQTRWGKIAASRVAPWGEGPVRARARGRLQRLLWGRCAAARVLPPLIASFTWARRESRSQGSQCRSRTVRSRGPAAGAAVPAASECDGCRRERRPRSSPEIEVSGGPGRAAPRGASCPKVPGLSVYPSAGLRVKENAAGEGSAGPLEPLSVRIDVKLGGSWCYDRRY